MDDGKMDNWFEKEIQNGMMDGWMDGLKNEIVEGWKDGSQTYRLMGDIDRRKKDKWTEG